MSIRKRVLKNGTVYIAQYSTSEKDAAGKRRRYTPSFATRKEAVEHLATVRVDIGKGTHVPTSRSITVEKAGSNWIDACGDLERTTVDGYRQHLALHILPYLGGLKLSSLTVATIRDWQDKLRKAVPAPGQAEAEPRTADMVKRVTGSLGSLLADAMERGHVGVNVVRSLKANRKRGKERQAERRAKGKLKIDVDIPTPAEIDAILAAATGKWRPFLLTAIRCGLRASELRGLTWADIDFKRAELHVRRRADAYNTIGQPKSEAGERVVPVPPATLQALREWKLKCPKGPLGLVFPNGAGAVENYANIVTRAIGPIMVAAGVSVPAVDKEGKPTKEPKYSGLHALRHYFASWCVNRRADGGLELPAKIVSERLGHSNIGITLDLYSHLFPRVDDTAELAAAEGAHG